MTDTSVKKISFIAYGITNELDLNKIAGDCGLKKKFSWEEPLILKEKCLKKVFEKDMSENQAVMIFAFGSVVFIDIEAKDEETFIKYLESHGADIDLKNWNNYKEFYELRVNKEKECEFEDKYVTVKEYEAFYSEMISTIIAKSIALERIEERVEGILDDIEPMIDKLEKGKLKTSDKELAKAVSKILRHEYSSLAYIMILDKPEITWASNVANEFYEKTSNFFELNERYTILKEKANILHNIMQGFTTIYHASRGYLIEWAIVVLIIAEVVLMVMELLK